MPKTFEKNVGARAVAAYDVLDFFAQHVTALRASLQENGAELDGEVVDPLLEGLLRGEGHRVFYGNVLLGTEINAAIPSRGVGFCTHRRRQGLVEREGEKVFSAASPLFDVIAQKLSADASPTACPPRAERPSKALERACSAQQA